MNAHILRNLSRAPQICQVTNILTNVSQKKLHNVTSYIYCIGTNSLHRKVKYEPFLKPDVENIAILFQRNYAMKQELKEYGIHWRRPEKVAPWRPEIAGDLKPFDEPDPSLPTLSMYELQDEIKSADEKVQKLLSLKFHDDYEMLRVAKYLMKRKYQRHQFDNTSPEVKIAIFTVRIRYTQKLLLNHKAPQTVKGRRVELHLLIDKRRKHLKFLRRKDYKLFEWLIEELGIIFRPLPQICIPITRRDSLKRLVKMHCDEIVQKKLDRYMEDLDAEKIPFLKEKEETLKWIADKETELGLPISVPLPVEADKKELDEFWSTEKSESSTKENEQKE